jgi:hypothetical protein
MNADADTIEVTLEYGLTSRRSAHLKVIQDSIIVGTIWQHTDRHGKTVYWAHRTNYLKPIVRKSSDVFATLFALFSVIYQKRFTTIVIRDVTKNPYLLDIDSNS